jgi:hypothetical protein
MLHELDKELIKRGHKFCRYADDCNIFVRSKRAGERVMQSITFYLENKLKLKVTQNKSAVDKPWNRKFLGISFYNTSEGIRVRVHDKSIIKLENKIREITSRSNAMNEEQRISRLNSLFRGWVNYFKIADMKSLLVSIDKWTRRRLRMCVWKSWKRIKTKLNNLIRFGMPRRKAWEYANTRKGYWRISNSLTNRHFESMGLLSLSGIFAKCY